VDGLKYLDLKQNDNSNIEKYGFVNSPKLRKLFLDYLFNFLLLPYTQNAPVPSSTNVQLALSNTTAITTSPPSQSSQPSQPEIPACLSESAFKQLKNDVNLENGDEIEEIKIGILKFLSFNIYNCEDILFHFIISTSDTRYKVVNAAELHIKRIVGGVDLNESNVVNRFYHLFLGDKVIKKTTSINNIEPANTRIRLKLLPYMLKSRGCASTIPQSIQLVFDCLFGSSTATNQKIKLYSVQFVHNMALYCEGEKLSKIGALLIQGMNKLIAESKDDNKLRGLAYVAVGKLARKIPDTIANDISVVHNFFSALEKEDSDTKMNIQEALVLMIDAFRNKNKDVKSLLLTLLFQYIENEISQCRSMAVKYTFEIFDHDDLESRFLLLLATSDSKEEIRQDAVKYLRRTQDPDGNDLKMASFEKWVEFISNKIEERLNRNFKVYTFGTHTLAFEPNCYQEILTILRMALSKSANLKNAQIVDSKSLESSKDETPLLFNYVKKLSQENLNCLFKYVNIIKEYALTVGNALAIYLLLEISSISPVKITKFLHENIEWLKNQSFSVNEQVRIYSAELWSLVTINNIIDQQNSNVKNEDYSSVIFDSLFATLDSINKTILANNLKSFETKHGALLCIGYSLGKYYNLLKSKLNNKSYIEIISNMISEIVSYLDDSNLSLAAIVSLGEIARNGPLIFKNNESKLEIVDVLNKKILTSKEKNKLKEKAAATLGYLPIHESLILDNNDNKKSTQIYKIDTKTFDSFNKYVMQKLLNSSQAKQVELNMTIGEALVNCALGKKSRARLNIWLTDFNSDEFEDINHEKNHQDDVGWLLNEILLNYMQNQNQHLRQASCFWLLILVKKCSSLSETVLKNLPNIQDAFISRLGENDEITQEVASKGVGVVFSLANDEQKKALVSRLVDTLGGNNSSKQKAQNKSTNLTSAESGLKITDENEQIFNTDQLGKAPDGTNITTYKEICSLASDLNKYKCF
jgi:proteasome component ECM29